MNSTTALINTEAFTPIEVSALINQNYTTNDKYDNTHIDLSPLSLSMKKTARVIRDLILEWVSRAQCNKKHMLTLKLSPTHARIHKYALDAGFRPHHADQKETVMALCLNNHPINKCNYPAYKTISVGVTAVVFNKTAEEFVAIKENSGPYRDWKAPTGGVDTGEEPVNAAVRELLEETGIKVQAKDAIFVGEGWTSNFRGNAPDLNQVFAFCVDETTQTLIPQPEEIEEVKWLSVKDFVILPVNLNHDKPFVAKDMVIAAQQALKNQTGWHAHNTAWATGKELKFYTSKSNL